MYFVNQAFIKVASLALCSSEDCGIFSLDTGMQIQSRIFSFYRDGNLYSKTYMAIHRVKPFASQQKTHLLLLGISKTFLLQNFHI